MKNKKDIKSIVIPLFFIILLFVSFLFSPIEDKTQYLEYKSFMEMVDKKEINKVYLNFNEDTFVATDNNNKNYNVNNPKYDTFKKDLLEKGIDVEEKSGNIGMINDIFFAFKIVIIWIILPIGIIILFYSAMKATKVNAIGKANFKNIETPPETNFDDVAGLDEAKQELKTVVDFLKNPDKYKDAGAKMPKGGILYGNPGTGKTLLAKAVAGEANVPFFSVSGSEFVELYVGNGAKKVRELWEKARSVAPCIIFIDEIDAIGKARGNNLSGGNDERDQTLNQLLKEMDGIEENEKPIFVLCATNRLELLDNALVRPGRFDKHICVPLPSTADERLKVIKLYSKNKKFAEDVNFDELAKQTIYFSPADIEALLNESAIIQIEKDKQFIDKECIDDAFFKKVLQGHAKKDKKRDEKEIELVAWHEAGHALVGKLYGLDIPKVTVTPSTSGAGGVTFINPKKMGLYSIEEMKNQISVSYGGRIAELLLLGDEEKVTTGASSDIKDATEKIKKMIMSYGMTKEFGLLNLEEMEIDNKVILKEAIKMSNELYNSTKDLLTKNKETLKRIADTLIEKETISGEELDELIKEESLCENQE